MYEILRKIFWIS